MNFFAKIVIFLIYIREYIYFFVFLLKNDKFFSQKRTEHQLSSFLSAANIFFSSLEILTCVTPSAFAVSVCE